MKKIACLLMASLLFMSSAFAVPQLSDNLFNCAKQALSYLSSGEYERLVTLLPFSDVAPSASEWESFSSNFSNLNSAQQDYAVAFWTGTVWKIAVPVHEPNTGSVEALVLSSEDGNTFCGYRYTNWSQIENEYSNSDHVLWNREYLSGTPTVVVD